MRKINIRVYEDDWNSVRTSFDLANGLLFGGALHVVQRCCSDAALDGENLADCELVFVDVLMADDASLGGYRILHSLLERKLTDVSRVVVMAGSSCVYAHLRAMGIDAASLTVLHKPFAYDMLAKVIGDAVERKEN